MLGKFAATVVVSSIFLLSHPTCTHSASGCLHHLTGKRGHISSLTDVTSFPCEWDITTDGGRIILINFEKRDTKGFRRGSDSCTSDILTFYDGRSSNSDVLDSFCGDNSFSDFGHLHLSTASTGNKLHAVLRRGRASETRFNLTFTTRVIEEEQAFDEDTFVPQTERTFSNQAVSDFVQLEINGWLFNNYKEIYPYAYTTAGSDIFELYIAIQERILGLELTPDISPASCFPINSDTRAMVQLFRRSDGTYTLDDWPWIPFYMYEYPWEENIAVVKYTYFNIKAGQTNSQLNEISCSANGEMIVKPIVKACPIGRFGRFCAERCQCYNGASCHSFNGACRCAPGWTGKNCNIENPELHISKSTSDLADLRYGQESQLTCTAYSFEVTNITWFFRDDGSVHRNLLNVTNYSNFSVLHVNSLVPAYEGLLTCEALSASGDKYDDTVNITIAGCQDNFYGEQCDQVCNCTEQATCDRFLGCPASEDTGSQTTLLALSLSAAGLVLLLLIAIFLLYRHKKRRVGNIDDPEVFQLEQSLKAIMPLAESSLSSSIDIELLKEREIDRSRLQVQQLLGEGAFGHVVKATLSQPDRDDEVVAVKKLKDNDDTNARKALLRETYTMLLCGYHDNVIGLKGICFRDGPLELVLEYAEHGSLLHLLWTLRAESKLNRTVLVNKRHIFENMMVEVCSGLEHLANRRLVHRDIAARNILICGKGTAKIADFGLARDMYAVGHHRQDRSSELLPLKWMAPEGLKNEALFTDKSDVWSFGVLLWEVAQLGRTPYPGMEGADRLYDALQNHFRLPRPQLCTEERYQLMLQCWKFNEKNRPGATAIRERLEADPNGFFCFNAPLAVMESGAQVTSV
ncbi:fibroblast growth factor receptor 4-like [Branchiostoma floridae x Branchiostoma japonicum]